MTLTEIENINVDNIVFSSGFRGTRKTIIPIGIRNESNDIQPLILKTPPNLLSFGVQEIKEKETDTVIGYQMPICLWDKRKTSNEEKQFSSKLEDIQNYCKEYLDDSRDEYSNITDDLLNKFNILNWKYENGVKVEEKGPILYVKLMNNKNKNITTYFVDDKTNTNIDPLDFLNKKCLVEAAIKFDNIVINNRVQLQLRLFEVRVKRINNRKTGPLHSLLDPKVVLKNPVNQIKKPKKLEGQLKNVNTFAVLDDDHSDNEENIEENNEKNNEENIEENIEENNEEVINNLLEDTINV